MAFTSKAMMPEGVEVRVTPLVKDAEGDLPKWCRLGLLGGRPCLTVMMSFQLTLMWLGRRL